MLDTTRYTTRQLTAFYEHKNVLKQQLLSPSCELSMLSSIIVEDTTRMAIKFKKRADNGIQLRRAVVEFETYLATYKYSYHLIDNEHEITLIVTIAMIL